ncbi:MAG TPA: sialidase family protein [Sphingomonadaceae bacterium]|nr:sialidase family protein [Sphingomonadaceae bacterium]
MRLGNALSKLNVSLAVTLLASCAGPMQSNAKSPSTLAIELSAGGAQRSASVPVVAVDPAAPNHVAVIWRYLNSGEPGSNAGLRGMNCYLSLSSDGGRTFVTNELVWNRPDTPVCNAPYVDIGPRGELLIGATLAGTLPQDAPEGTHAAGRVVMRLSHDWGRSWSPIRSGIGTGDEVRFAANPAVPSEATHVPWDGGRGLIDDKTGAIFMSGGFPAPPGGKLHSQRFYTRSTNEGADFGPIYAFGDSNWPQRWDGRMIVSHGIFAVSYLAGAVPVSGAKCLCVVFATSADNGRTLERHFVTEAGSFDRLVHYPPIAADPTRARAYALALVLPDEPLPVVRLTSDGGSSWTVATMPPPPADIARASRPDLAYTPDGRLVLVWRGYHADGSYDTYVALASRGKFGPALKASTAASIVPAGWERDYSVTGDFINTIDASREAVHVAWTDWSTGGSGQIMYRRIPLAELAAP